MTYNKHDTLNGGSRVRLRKMRDYAARWNSDESKKRRGVSPITWRDARRFGRGAIGTDAHGLRVSKCGGYANVPESVLGGLRWKFADDVMREAGRRDGASFYADSHMCEVYRGAVWQLPSRDGSECWIAGYVERESVKPNGGSVSGYAVLSTWRGLPRYFTSAEGAASFAASLAESHANESREYDERWQEASRANDEREEAREALKAARAEASRLVAALREQRKAGAIMPALCDVLRDKVRACREAMREALETIADKAAEIDRLGMAGDF